MVSTRQSVNSRKFAEGELAPSGVDGEYEEPATQAGKTRGTKRARSTKTGGNKIEKRTKKKKEERRHKKAKLSMLPEMPIDILFEIFSLVHPKDLLHASWTARIFNGFLTSKSSRHVWQASFETVQGRERPPPCPSGITEMAYANLVYGRYCMNCSNVGATIQAWTVLMRICESCVEEVAVDLYDLSDRTLPAFRVEYKNREVIEMVLRVDNKRYEKELAAAKKKPQSRKVVLEKYESLVREREKFSNAMLKVEKFADELKEEARADIQKRRIDQIWERLSEIGWREEIEARKSMYEPGLLKIKGVMMIRPLGEKAWADLREPLNNFMEREFEDVRAQLITDRSRSRVDKIEDIIDAFRFSLPHPHDFCPSIGDICWIPEVREAIVDGTDEEFQDCEADIRSRIPELTATWLEERRAFFLQLLPQESPTLEHLSLATTLFDCTNCRTPGMRIEKALSHRCYNLSDRELGVQFSSPASKNFYHDRVRSPWNSDFSRYKYSPELADVVRGIILECGENPDTITTREMTRRHHRFAHHGGGGTVTVMNWFEACKYERSYHSSPHCRFLRPEELPDYVPEPGDRGSDWCFFDRGDDWGCFHCWGKGPGKPEWYCKNFVAIKDHLALSHQIHDPTEDDYFNKVPNYATPFRYRPANGA